MQRLSALAIIDAYKRRWGIETGYMQVEMIRPATRSVDQSVRMILFFTALCMYNVWAITRSGSESKTGLEMKIVVYNILLTSLMRCELSGGPVIGEFVVRGATFPYTDYM